MVPLLHFSAQCDIFWEKKIQKFEVFYQNFIETRLLRFLSLRFSADFGLSRLFLCLKRQNAVLVILFCVKPTSILNNLVQVRCDHHSHLIEFCAGNILCTLYETQKSLKGIHTAQV